MEEIPFTQFKMPDGRPVKTAIARPAEIAEKAKIILDAGYVFECEVLPTGDVSFTITDEDEGDVAIQVCPNGPDVPGTIDKLILDFQP